jgi:ankyrin repeat protein
LEVVRELCVRGAHVNAARTDSGVTALILASFKGRLEVARLLLQKGADKFFTDTNGNTAFSAATGPHKASLQALLQL